MSRRPAAELPSLALPSDRPDPELEAMPEPRRPGRTLTLVTMSVTALLSLTMAFAVSSEATYGLRTGSPVDLGNLTELAPRPDLANTWIRGEALLDLKVSGGTSGTITGQFDLTAAQVQEVSASRYYVQLASEKAAEGNLWGWLMPQQEKGR